MYTASIRSRRNRPAARLMVLVWVLALMTSLAIACVLGRGAAVQVQGHGHSNMAASELGHNAAWKDHCELAQDAVLKTRASDALDTAASLLLTVDRWTAPPARAATAVTLAVASDPPPNPAVAIRFLRLTL